MAAARATFANEVGCFPHPCPAPSTGSGWAQRCRRFRALPTGGGRGGAVAQRTGRRPAAGEGAQVFDSLPTMIEMKCCS
jgi:hypothetical protein